MDDGSSYTGLASFLEPNNILYLISQFPHYLGGSGSKSLMDLVSIKLLSNSKICKQYTAIEI